MRRVIPSSVILAAALAAALPCRSQTLGPILSYEYGVPLAIERSPGVVNVYGSSGDGRSSNHTLFAGARLDAGIAESLFLSPRLGFALSTGRFTADPFTAPNAGTRPVVTTREYEVTATTALLRVDAPFRWEAAEWLGLTLGPWGSLRLTSGLYQVERILGPAGAIYRDSTRERAVAAGDLLGSSALRGGILAGLVVALPIGAGSRIDLEIFGRVDAAALADGLATRSLSAGTSASIVMPLVSAAPEPLVAAPSVLRPAARLTAAIDLGDGDNPVRLTPLVTHHRLEVRTPREFTFAADQTEIPPSLHRLARQTVGAFSERDLLRLEPAEALRHGLNFLGRALVMYPDGHIALVGGYAGSEEPLVASTRVERLRAYLVEVWGIEPERISIQASDTLRRRVVRVEGDPRIAQGWFQSEWIERSWSASRLDMRKQIVADAGVRSWSIVLRQGARELARYDARGEGVPQRFTLSGERPLVPVTAELIVEDSAGGMAIARDTIQVDAAESASPAREKLTVVLPDDGGVPGEMSSLVRRVRAGADLEVSIVGAGEALRLSAADAAEALLGALRARQVPVARLDLRLPDTEPAPADAVVVRVLQSADGDSVERNAARGG